jgi:hypothetical protein
MDRLRPTISLSLFLIRPPLEQTPCGLGSFPVEDRRVISRPMNGGSHEKGGKPQLPASREEESHECHARELRFKPLQSTFVPSGSEVIPR